MLQQQLIGQVYSANRGTYTSKNGEVKGWISFRLGMDKPYREQVQQADGSTKEQRQKTFVTVKAFNGISDAFATFLGDSAGGGEWVQLTGHFEVNNYDRKVQVEHPDDENKILNIEIPTDSLEFHMSSFGWLSQPQQSTVKKSGSVVSATVTSKTVPVAVGVGSEAPF